MIIPLISATIILLKPFLYFVLTFICIFIYYLIWMVFTAIATCHVCQSRSSTLYYVVSRPSRFVHGVQKRGCHDRRKHKGKFTLCSRRPQRTVVRSEISSIFLCIQGVLGLSMLSHGLSWYPRQAVGGGGGMPPEHVSVRGFLRIGARSLQARHVLIGSFTFFPSDKRSDTFFPFLRLGPRTALEHVCGHGLKIRPPNQ